ncbi:hypothetical protein V1264_024707 [Littorina saxatilis]|uniref:Uncharacterized protein n=1 Tax=Littorina saxatilis TaxID=31220 RepID=A0AAN9FZP7_9CAEN
MNAMQGPSNFVTVIAVFAIVIFLELSGATANDDVRTKKSQHNVIRKSDDDTTLSPSYRRLPPLFPVDCVCAKPPCSRCHDFLDFFFEGKKKR